MSILSKLRAELSENGYSSDVGHATELTIEQLASVKVGGADWFESFQSDGTGVGGQPAFAEAMWHTGVQPVQQ